MITPGSRQANGYDPMSSEAASPPPPKASSDPRPSDG